MICPKSCNRIVTEPGLEFKSLDSQFIAISTIKHNIVLDLYRTLWLTKYFPKHEVSYPPGRWADMVDRIMASKDSHILIIRTFQYAILHSKGN